RTLLFFLTTRNTTLETRLCSSAVEGVACGRKSASWFVRVSHAVGTRSRNCSSRRAWVCLRSPLWIPDSTITNLYPASAAFAMTEVKFVVLPLCTYPTTRPFDAHFASCGRGV